ncbi:MAG: carbohydrate ABC transporter permease [Anaerolineae bacterium]
MNQSISIPAAPRGRRRQLSDSTIQRLFIMPTLILLILWNIFPLFYSLFLSFTQYSHSGKTPPLWIGAGNFDALLRDPQIWASFAVTGRYALLSVFFQAVIGFGLALLLRARFKASGLLTTLILIPMMLSPVIVGMFWRLIFNPLTGIFNYLIGFWDPTTSPVWLKDYPLISVVIVDVWMWSPFVMLLCLSGLKAIPDYIYEAAAVDRASSWRQFWRITLPQVAPLLLLAILFRTIEALKAFDLVMGLTGGGPGNATETVSVALYRMVFQGQARTGMASALAYIVLIVIIAVSNVYIWYLNKMKEA